MLIPIINSKLINPSVLATSPQEVLRHLKVHHSPRLAKGVIVGLYPFSLALQMRPIITVALMSTVSIINVHARPEQQIGDVDAVLLRRDVERRVPVHAAMRFEEVAAACGVRLDDLLDLAQGPVVQYRGV